MNRKETRLLVENWRKVLDEGLYDSDSELLEEINLKRGLAIAGLAATLFGSVLGGASTADAKLRGLTLDQNTAVEKVIQSAFENKKLTREQMKDLFELMNKAQSDDTVEMTSLEKSQVEHLIKMHKKMVDELQKNLDLAKKNCKEAYKKYKDYVKLHPDATYAKFNSEEREVSGDLEIALDELKEARQAMKEFHKLHLEFKIDKQDLPNGFKETKVILDKAGNVVEVDGKKLYYVTKTVTVN
tara:strand:+ start:2442 stop:3167 length:726 start_codon:yes stop_codon:yes gene_type:complete